MHPLVLVDTTSRVNRAQILPDIYRFPRRRVTCNTSKCTFEPQHPRIIFPEPYLRLAHLYRECQDDADDKDILFESKVYENDVFDLVVPGPCGILCVSSDAIDTMCVKTLGTTLHLVPGVMMVLRTREEAHLNILKESGNGVATMIFLNLVETRA